MPLVEASSYRAPLLLRNGHLQTVCQFVVRRAGGENYLRERIRTPDGDFLDLDWSDADGNELAVILHGMESSSWENHVMGMVRAFNRVGWDAVAINLRGCSGEPNLKLRSYHGGFTDDIDTVIRHVLDCRAYHRIALVGFSLGGNILLKYLGERPDDVPPVVRRAVGVSVPCDLEACAWKLAERSNRSYMRRFVRSFQRKYRQKARLLPGLVDLKTFDGISTFKELDDSITAPIHGFSSAEDYWRQSSSKGFIHAIRVPSLIINARDDPFLALEANPTESARESEHVFLETPTHGGHCGFIRFGHKGVYWSEARAVSFCTS